LHCINCGVVDGCVRGVPGDLITWVSVTTYGPGGYFDGLLSVCLSALIIVVRFACELANVVRYEGVFAG